MIGPTSAASCLLGSHPVGMNSAVMRPQAMNAPMLGMTMPARNPPMRWTCTRAPVPEAGARNGSADDVIRCSSCYENLWVDREPGSRLAHGRLGWLDAEARCCRDALADSVPSDE